MKKSFIAKLIALPCIVLATWWLTSGVVAGVKRVKQGPEQSAQMQESASKTLVEGAGQVAVQRQVAIPDNLIASHQLTSFQVGGQNGAVVVHASVEMMSKLKGIPHVWRLKVLDKIANESISDTPYLNQIFEIDPSGSMEVAFDEVLPLEPGSYRVQLSLYRVPDNTTVEQMFNLDPAELNRFTLIRMNQDVSVP